jgi:hypothetical protein
MGFTTPDLPPCGAEAVVRLPFKERIRVLDKHWVDYGFGVPKVLTLFYVAKIAAYIGLGILLVGLTTPDLGGWGEFTSWWTEPIVYLKLMVWSILCEILGLSASSGPLSFNIKPLFGGVFYWLRPNSLRQPPWERIPFTRGDRRTVFDVALYVIILANLVYLLVAPGQRHDLVPDGKAGLLPSWAILSYLVLICVMGLRDKTVFLAARSEQYPLILLAFAVLTNYTDMILAAKITIVIVWCGAAFSKIGHHFSPTVAVMMSNTPWVPGTWIKRKLYKNFPNDLRPSGFTHFMAHGPGTILECAAPLVLLFSTNRTVTLLALLAVLSFHLFIISTIPLAVPLEWNLFFMFSAVFLFWGHDAGAGFAVTDFSNPWIALVVVASILIWPILGNLKPEWISFLVSYRQYAGNWAATCWAWKDAAAERKIDECIVKGGAQHSAQIVDAFGEDLGEMFTQKANAWRSLHTSGRAMHSIMPRFVDIDTYRIREGETVVSGIMGWNFGEGHLHDERLLASVQKRCDYAPGDLVVVYTESQPIQRNYVEYRVIDAALGVVERGTFIVTDASEACPWLADGPIPHTVTWQLPGYSFPGRASTSVGGTDAAPVTAPEPA